MNSVFHLSMVGFNVSHIIQHHYILWSAPFQIVNPKVNNSYIYDVSLVMMYVFRSLYIIPQIPFVRNPFNPFYSTLFCRFHPFSLGQKPVCRVLVKTFI